MMSAQIAENQDEYQKQNEQLGKCMKLGVLVFKE